MKNRLDAAPFQLSEAAILAYRAEGYCRLGRILDDPTLAILRHEELRFRQHNDQGTRFRSRVHYASSAVRATSFSGPHLAQVIQLLGPDIAFQWMQFVTKMPAAEGLDSAFPWHQDCGYMDINPTPLTIWVALDDVDEQNGCVWVVPRSHTNGLLAHTKASAESWHLTVPVSEAGIPVPLRAGEAVAFTGYTLHRSLSNKTQLPRRAFFLEYAPASARYLPSGQPVALAPYNTMVAGEIPASAGFGQGEV